MTLLNSLRIIKKQLFNALIRGDIANNGFCVNLGKTNFLRQQFVSNHWLWAVPLTKTNFVWLLKSIS